MHRRLDRSSPGVGAAVLLAVAVFALGACSSAPPPGSSPSLGAVASAGASPAPQWEPQNAWERAVIDVDATGAYSKEAALRLFATAYGPLPGVDVQQDLRGVFSRTIAIRAVQRHREALTDEQRAAVDAYLTPPADATTIEIPPVAALGPWRLVNADPGISQAIREVAEEARIDIAAKMGGDFDGFMQVTFIPRPASVQPIDGVYPNGGSQAQYLFGAFQGCKISIYDEATTQSGLQLTALMTHEVFHCFQQAIHETQAIHDAAPDWITEGQATWVGLELGGPSPNYARFWDRYLVQPWISLVTRAYDAVGFYSHLHETGTDPWTVFRPMLEAGTDSMAAYRAAGADSEVFVDSWASGVLRDGAPGSAWNITGPGITASAYTPVTYAIGDGSAYALSQPFFTNDIDRYVASTDMVEIEIDGHARLRYGSVDTPLHGGGRYCVEGRDCSKVCPGEQPPEIDGVIGSEFLLAESGGSEGLVGHIRGIKLEEPECSEPPSAEPTEGEFCKRYRDYVDWATALGPDTDITQELAAQIAARFEGMYPVAPQELQEWVALVWRIYATFAQLEVPANIPATGHIGGIEKLPDALMAMHAYCGIPWPGA